MHLLKNKKNIGWWTQGTSEPEAEDDAVKKAIARVTEPVFLLNMDGRLAAGRGGTITIGDLTEADAVTHSLCAYSPPLPPENLGDPYFKKKHNLRYAYIAGAMANGITSVRMVKETGFAQMLGFFGAAGLPLNKIEAAICDLKKHNLPFGFNLIHSPNDPELEAAVVSLYLKHEIRLVSASAYLDLTLPLVYFRVHGIHNDQNGNIVCPNRIIAKVSRVEVARKFLSPPPEKLLTRLVERKMITTQEAALAALIPMAEDLTAEADSGGHTDNRPAITLLPTMLALRDKIAEKYRYTTPLCVGLGGGIATPYSVAAAFAMGAAYILTGSINQSCIEAGTSETVRQMLSEAGQADVTMAPAADMFEMGVKVQVLKRGTMFPFRALKLYDLYSMHESYESIPEKQRRVLEHDLFRCSFEESWGQTKGFFLRHDPKQIELAEKDPKHKMALVFRSYLGQSSSWATTGNPSRKMDYQIWCGPAIGAFNEWVKGSFLENAENRKTVAIAMNLLYGASVVTRASLLRSYGVTLPANAGSFSPMELSEIYRLI